MGTLSQVGALRRGAGGVGLWTPSKHVPGRATTKRFVIFFFFWKIIEERAPRAQTWQRKALRSPRGLHVEQMAEVGNLFRFNFLLESPPCLVGEEIETQRDAGGRRGQIS